MHKIAIASGKGGTGKTFLSTNLFMSLCVAGHDTILVDCDAEVPNDHLFLNGVELCTENTRVLCPEIDTEVCVRCGKCMEFCSYNAITCIPSMNYIKLSTDLCHGCGACLYACSVGAVVEQQKTSGYVTTYEIRDVDNLVASKVDSSVDKSLNDSRMDDLIMVEAKLKEGEHSPVPVIRQAIAAAERYQPEYMILDAPPGCSCPFVSTVSDADQVILVTEPTPFGLSDLKHTIEVLRSINKPFSVVINRSDMGDDSMRQYLDSEGIEVLADFAYSEDIASAYSAGKLVIETSESLRKTFQILMSKVLV